MSGRTGAALLQPGSGCARAAGGGTGATPRLALGPTGPGIADSAGRVPVPAARSQGTGMTGQPRWRSFLELGALPGAVPCARLHAKHVLREWGLAALAGTAELLVSELATNAVNVSQSTEGILPLRLWLTSGGHEVEIFVWDTCAQPPVKTHADGAAENGRGLVLVETLSADWGWYPAKDMGGKVVWCVVTE